MLIRGNRLNEQQRQIVLAAFLYRNTVEHPRPIWGLDCKTGKRVETPPTQTDDEWLASHAFHFVRDGSRLMHNRHRCEPAYMAD